VTAGPTATVAGRADGGSPATLATGRVAWAIGIVGTLAIMLLDACVRDEPQPRGDDLIYERMADDPFAAHTFVFAYRVAVPWVVHALPLHHDLSFSTIAWLCSGAAGAVLFVLLERLGISRRVSVPLAFVLVLSPPLLVASLRQGRNPDPLTVLIMVTGALFIVERWPRALAATMLSARSIASRRCFSRPWRTRSGPSVRWTARCWRACWPWPHRLSSRSPGCGSPSPPWAESRCRATASR
jgi:hypothetical protein